MSAREYEKWRDAHTWDPSRGSGLVLHWDLAPAAWIGPRVQDDRECQVGGLVPGGFGGYARIFFPFIVDVVASGPDEQTWTEVTWKEMAQRNGRVAHALMEEDNICAGQDDSRTSRYAEMAPRQFGALLSVLARHTASPESWFLLWDGFGNLNERVFSPAPKVRHPGRDYYLLSGQHMAYRSFPDEPSFWWPEDQAWCVCTDTDIDWAYVAGSAACIKEILAVPVIDAWATTPEDPAHVGMDVINKLGK